MSDRKYRQRGYQDDGPSPSKAERRPSKPKSREPRGQLPLRPPSPNMPGFHDVIRCARCGRLLDAPIDETSTCAQCGSALHSCAQCAWFDTGSRFECAQPIKARVTPKDGQNDCGHFAPRVTVERQTRSQRGPSSAKQAFDDLFK
ncbi:MAG: hypothetical protein QF463_03090 [Vicinamibacterales bacterium]|nr:hypothetical protein [Vicinamibacterales bacterium]